MRNAVGFFASRLYLRIDSAEGDSFLDLLDRVTEEYCNASEHDDFSYLETRVPPPGCAQNTFFNWIPQGSDASILQLPESDDAITTSPIPFAHPWFKSVEWDNEPMTLLQDTAGGITGGVYFPLQRLSVATMERFGRNFLMVIEKLLREPQGRIRSF